MTGLGPSSVEQAEVAVQVAVALVVVVVVDLCEKDRVSLNGLIN